MRDLVTTLFEVAGMLLLALALGVWLYGVHPALGAGAGGMALLFEAAIITALDGKR